MSLEYLLCVVNVVFCRFFFDFVVVGFNVRLKARLDSYKIQRLGREGYFVMSVVVFSYSAPDSWFSVSIAIVVSGSNVVIVGFSSSQNTIRWNGGGARGLLVTFDG